MPIKPFPDFRIRIYLSHSLLKSLVSPTYLPCDLSSLSLPRVVVTEIAYAVAFTLVDGVIDKAIQVRKGETSVNSLAQDIKLEFQKNRANTYLPMEGVRKRK